MGKTRSACPACKEPGEWRDASDVCTSCRALINEGLMRRREISQTPDVVIARLPFAAHGLPYILHAPDARDPFFELLKAISTPAPHEAKGGFGAGAVFVAGQKSGWDDGDYVSVRSDLLPLLDDLYQRILEGAKCAYEEGYNDGANLLVRIAEGELSIAEINKATVNAK
jgi:hypothetical protein